MNLIWEIVLRAEASEKRREDLFFRQAKDYSPWYEQSFSNLNQKEVEEGTVEINALYRFDAIFGGLLHPEMKTMPCYRTYLFDLAIHLLCEAEVWQGMTRHEFYIRRLEREILAGALGAWNRENYQACSAEQKGCLASLAFSQLRTGTSLHLFRKAILVVYPEALLYQIKKEPEQLLLYIDREKTETLNQAIQFVLDMFLPIHCRTRIFWKNHFGVVGMEAVMRLGEIEIF